MKVTLMLFLVLFVVHQIFSDDSDSTKSGSDSLVSRFGRRRSSCRRRSGVRIGDPVNNWGLGGGYSCGCLAWWEICLIVLGCLFLVFLLYICNKSNRSGYIPSYNSYRHVLGENPTGSALEEGQGDLGGGQGDLGGGQGDLGGAQGDISGGQGDLSGAQVDLGGGVRPPDYFDVPPSYPASAYSIPEPSQDDPPPPSYNA